jgi:hypothetical protein
MIWNTQSHFIAFGSATPKGSVAESSRSEEDEQKAALINQVLELQNTLDGMLAA